MPAEVEMPAPTWRKISGIVESGGRKVRGHRKIGEENRKSRESHTVNKISSTH